MFKEIFFLKQRKPNNLEKKKEIACPLVSQEQSQPTSELPVILSESNGSDNNQPEKLLTERELRDQKRLLQKQKDIGAFFNAFEGSEAPHSLDELMAKGIISGNEFNFFYDDGYIESKRSESCKIERVDENIVYYYIANGEISGSVSVDKFLNALSRGILKIKEEEQLSSERELRYNEHSLRMRKAIEFFFNSLKGSGISYSLAELNEQGIKEGIIFDFEFYNEYTETMRKQFAIIKKVSAESIEYLEPEFDIRGNMSPDKLLNSLNNGIIKFRKDDASTEC